MKVRITITATVNSNKMVEALETIVKFFRFHLISTINDVSIQFDPNSIVIAKEKE